VEVRRAEEQGVRILTVLDSEYPAVLKEIHSPPLALYVRGALESRDRHAVAVVGTRHPTHYGMETAGKLAFLLAQAGYTVVSGLALGIDTAAHEGALKAKGRTLAVIGGGMEKLYPPSNAKLADAIAGSGAVLSEYPMARSPDKTTFPVRNRIVSGLSLGVLVIEAGRTSGALQTANQALEQGRAVFAVPGRIDSPASWGTHELIKNGARLVTGLEDILSEFEDLVARPVGRVAATARPAARVEGLEASILDLLCKGETDVDSLIRSSGAGAADVNSTLICLEMKKLVRMLPGRVVTAVR
jgi:DNA processing protein